MSQNSFIALVYLFQNELIPRHPNGGMVSAAADKVTVDVTNLNQLAEIRFLTGAPTKPSIPIIPPPRPWKGRSGAECGKKNPDLVFFPKPTAVVPWLTHRSFLFLYRITSEEQNAGLVQSDA